MPSRVGSNPARALSGDHGSYSHSKVAKIQSHAMIKRSIQRIVQCIVLAASLAASAPTSAADAGDDFLAAREAFRSGDARRLDFYASRLQSYVLEPYVTFWRLRLRLEEASPADIQRF